MANELTLQIALSYLNGTIKANRSENVQLDVAGEDWDGATEETSTVESTLGIGSDVATVGYLFLRNHSSTAGEYIEVGISTGVYHIKLDIGEVALFRPNGSTIYVKAASGTPKIEFLAIED